VLLGLYTAVASLAQETPPPHIAVYGTATTEVTPDQMVWSLAVRNKGPALDGVAANHTKIVQSALAALKDNGVDAKTIQTSRMEFGENWEYISSSRVKQGYFASTQMSFKLTNFDLYGKLWVALSHISDLSVQGVAFDHTKRIDYQNETRQKAVLAAREKASVLAKALGNEIGEPLFVEEEFISSAPMGANVFNNVRTISDGAGDGNGAVAPGTIPITTRVHASFRLLPKVK
jgi:uncharacterized protein YggE